MFSRRMPTRVALAWYIAVFIESTCGAATNPAFPTTATQDVDITVSIPSVVILDATAQTSTTDPGAAHPTATEIAVVTGMSTNDQLVIGEAPTDRQGVPAVCPTFPSTEIGLCPITERTCSSDASCANGKICCRKGCGKECVHACQPVENCDKTCLDGFLRDENNCSTCACAATPAPPVDSGAGRSAELHKQRNDTCPEFQSWIGLCGRDTVVEICVFDADCAADLKCCRSGCGKSCVKPCFEPACDVSCNSGYKVDANHCATCECASALDEQPQTTETPSVQQPTNQTADGVLKMTMELEVVATGATGTSAADWVKVLTASPTIANSISQQLQSQFGLFPGQLSVEGVEVAQKEGHLLVSLALSPSNNSDGKAGVDETVSLMGERSRNGHLWLTYQEKETGAFYKLRSVGIMAIGGGTAGGHKQRQVIAIVVAIMGLLLLVVILSIIAFVNWRAERRKKLLLSGAQRHSGVQVTFDNVQSTTFINPFAPEPALHPLSARHNK